MPGPLPKPASQRQRRNRPKDLKVIPGGLVDRLVPDPPEELLRQTRARWVAYWESDLAQLADPVTDIMAIERLFTLYDERERAHRMAREEPFIEGSQGQPVVNPMTRIRSDLDKEIRMLEDRFGLTPKSRLALGISFGEMSKSVADLNRSIAQDFDDDGDEVADPRQATS